MIAKYFWDLKRSALEETRRILKDPAHPQFPRRMTMLLERCSAPKELFSVVPRERFVRSWPRVRAYWLKRARRSDSRDWWETLYEQFLETAGKKSIIAKGAPSTFFQKFGEFRFVQAAMKDDSFLLERWN